MLNLFLIVIFLLSSSETHVRGMKYSEVHQRSEIAQVWDETEPFEGSVAPPNDGRGEYMVCVKSANVYGSPDASRIVRYAIPDGTVVNVRERARFTEEGWAMIQPAYWVSAHDLCRPE